jgi:tRNA-binding EMAP/Myf-like protein
VRRLGAYPRLRSPLRITDRAVVAAAVAVRTPAAVVVADIPVVAVIRPAAVVMVVVAVAMVAAVTGRKRLRL